MVSGQAPPFGWYWSSSRSRASAPSPSAIRVTSPVAFGWFVESSPRSSATLKQRPPAARPTAAASSAWSPHVARQPFSFGSSASSGLFANSVPPPASKASRGALVIAFPGGPPRPPPPAGGGARVAAVLPGEFDAELLQPADRAPSVAGQRLHEPHVRTLVRALEDVRRMLLGRVVVAERRLDASLSLGRVAGLDRPLRREADSCAGALG